MTFIEQIKKVPPIGWGILIISTANAIILPYQMLKNLVAFEFGMFLWNLFLFFVVAFIIIKTQREYFKWKQKKK